MEKFNVNGVSLDIKEYMGHRVVTFRDIDIVHNRPEGTASRNFRVNRKHFIEGEDFFVVKPENILMSNIRTLGFEVRNRGITLLTESGYLMIVKSFTDDFAWTVQRKFLDAYFKSKESANSCDDILLTPAQKQNET